MPVEYSGEEQAICAVGIVQPRPGVFMAAIQHILVLCTTVEVHPAAQHHAPHQTRLDSGREEASEVPVVKKKQSCADRCVLLVYDRGYTKLLWQVVLLGVCCSGEGGLDMQLQPLPLYTAPSNGDSHIWTLHPCMSDDVLSSVKIWLQHLP